MSVDLRGFYGDAAAAELACRYVDDRMADAAIGVKFVDAETPSGAIDGVNAVFTLQDEPNPPESLKLYQGGLRLTAGDDFILSGNQITYTQAPEIGRSHVADYRY